MMTKAPIPVPRKLFGVSNNKFFDGSKGNIRNCDVNKTVNKKLSTNGEFLGRESNVNPSSDPDLNLSTLICSVERDIELLEQLEMNSGEHRGALPLPVSSKLLGLPGYRPRGNTGQCSTATSCFGVYDIKQQFYQYLKILYR